MENDFLVVCDSKEFYQFLADHRGKLDHKFYGSKFSSRSKYVDILSGKCVAESKKFKSTSSFAVNRSYK